MKYSTRGILTTVFTLLLIGAAVGAGVSNIQGNKLLSVQTKSMVPVLKKGDLVSVKHVPVEQLHIGDIVTFVNPANKKQTITHRIVAFKNEMNGLNIITKGDANLATDPAITAASVVGKLQHKTPYVGYVMDFVRKPIGLILLIYIPALAIVFEEIKRLIAYYRSQEPYIMPQYASRRLGIYKSKLAGISKFVAFVLATSLITVAVVHAALNSTATLSGSSITTAVVSPPAGGSNNTNTHTSCTNTVNVYTSSSQTATSGSSSNNNNADGGSATSGNASNNNSNSVNINITGCH